MKSLYFNVTHENRVGFYVKRVYPIQSILAIALWKLDCAIIMENCRSLFSESCYFYAVLSMGGFLFVIASVYNLFKVSVSK